MMGVSVAAAHQISGDGGLGLLRVLYPMRFLTLALAEVH